MPAGAARTRPRTPDSTMKRLLLTALAALLPALGCADGDKTGKTDGPADGNDGVGKNPPVAKGDGKTAKVEPEPVEDPLRIKPEQIGDWPTFLGPEHTGVSRETGLLETWPAGGPPVVWKMELGETYAAPSVVRDAAIVFHRVNKPDDTAEEVIERLDPATGRRAWRYGYPTSYRDQFGYNNGPRSAPTIDGGRVYTLGAEGRLTCVDLETGKLVWTRALHVEYFKEPRQNFFGVGVAPRIDGDAILLNIGDDRSGCITAIDKHSGKTLWRSGEDGASYCTAFCADVGGSRFAFFLTREGAVWCAVGDGFIRKRYPFRSRDRFSANAASPVVIGDKLLLSAAYDVGSALLAVDEKGYQELWRNTALGSHWATPIHHDGYLYGFDGRHEFEATLRCVRLSDGQVMWSRDGNERNAGGEVVSTEKGYERGSMIRAQGKYVILTEKGRLVLAELTPKDCREISSAQVLGRHCWTAPVLSRGLLYLLQYDHRIDKATLLCLDLRAK
jgi:outer membrane protein assembly factor BamB